MRDESVTLTTFPQSQHEALAILYVEKNMTADTTPEEMHSMYRDALDRIQKSNRSNPIYR